MHLWTTELVMGPTYMAVWNYYISEYPKVNSMDNGNKIYKTENKNVPIKAIALHTAVL